MNLYLEIFITFFKLGTFSFGGGYAMIPLIEREICQNKKWVDHEKLQDVFAIAGALPGAIALNASTFIGYMLKGIPGAIVALTANVIPSVLIMVILISSFLQIKDNIFVQNAFYGIRPAVVALIAYASVNMIKNDVRDISSILIFAVSLILCFVPGLSIIFIILGTAAAGIAVKEWRARRQKND